MSAQHRILFVCMGNICRSPTAEGVFRKLIAERDVAHLFEVDSAGTHAYHVGDPPDPRSIQAASRRGIDLTPIRARRFERVDFERFDLVLAMDSDNRARLEAQGDPRHHAQIRMILEFARRAERLEVPDPYYGGPNGFEEVLDLLEDASEGLLESLLR